MATAAETRLRRSWRTATDAARRPVAADSVALLRIVFGAVVALAAARFLARGWVEDLYLAPEHHLTYTGFDWVQPLPDPLMYAEVVGVGLLGLCIALGFHHRIAAASFVVCFAHLELIDAALYLNHYWLVTLVAVLLAILPVHHQWSLDARAGRVTASSTVPAVTVWALRAQVAVVYVFAGLAKINHDWLSDALPLRLWLTDRVGTPLVGPILDNPFTAHALSWAGMVFDLTIVVWLSWRRTRLVAYLAVVAFHAVTAVLFPIGIFPWLMIGLTPILFAPDWPERLAARVRPRLHLPARRAQRAPSAVRVGRPALIALGLLAAVELVLPLRHLAYPGDVRWTEEGSYGAWRVMLTEKTGYLSFRVQPSGTQRIRVVDPASVLTDWQVAQAAIRPDLLHAAALLVADRYRNEHGEPKVFADAYVSFMGGPARRLVDPKVDLAALPRTLGHQTWILPTPTR